MAASTLRLDPMNPEEYDRFVAVLVPDYAQENVAAGYWEASSAVARARAELDQLLPKGRDTPDHFFFTLRVGPEGTRVGALWFAIRRPPAPPGGFIYDIVIDQPHRRHGYGEAAMRELERFARPHGVDRIGLHVFGTNSKAIDLYRKLGYETTSLLMTKRLD